MKIELLEQSFAAIAPRGDKLVDAFYRNLFADFPSVRPLFANVEMSVQKKKLLASLKLVVANLRHPSSLVAALEDLGARHVDYGAEEEHYPAVGATLLKSLSEIAGDAWTKDLQIAWSEVYEKASKAMIAGAAVPAN